MIKIRKKTICQVSRLEAFKEFSCIPQYYNDLSPGHLYYKPNGSFNLGTIINVGEKSGFQKVEHQYKITEITSNEKVAMVSAFSKVKIFGIFRSVSTSCVEFNFKDNESNTEITLDIAIKFASPFREVLAFIFLTNFIWNSHAEKELQALCQIIEKRCCK